MILRTRTLSARHLQAFRSAHQVRHYGNEERERTLSPLFAGGRSTSRANTGIVFVPQQSAYIVERFGRYSRTLDAGLAFLIPVIDKIPYVKSLKEVAMEIPSQSAITLDNVTLDIDGVLYFRVVDAYKASYGVEDAEYAVSQLAQTTMRSEIGQLSLDAVLRERANLNHNITTAINDASAAWGVECLRYEIRDIHPPKNVLLAMHRQVSAERSKRAEILESEGQRQSAINIAEGQKQSTILASEADKARQVNMAAGNAESILLNARATAQGIEAIASSIRDNGSYGRDAVALRVAERYVDAYGQLAKKGTSIVVPSSSGDMGQLIASAMGIFKTINAGHALPDTTGNTEQDDHQPRNKVKERVEREMAELESKSTDELKKM
ncbi:Synaptotagmin-like protein 2 [Savitreella phatthalungensis]